MWLAACLIRAPNAQRLDEQVDNGPRPWFGWTRRDARIQFPGLASGVATPAPTSCADKGSPWRLHHPRSVIGIGDRMDRSGQTCRG